MTTTTNWLSTFDLHNIYFIIKLNLFVDTDLTFMWILWSWLIYDNFDI